MADNSKKVNKQTLYIACGAVLVVGVLAGIIFSSVQSENYSPVAQQQAASPQVAQAISPQQASTILALEQQVSSNPTDADAWSQLGNTYFDVNKFAKAIRAYNKYLELRPANPNILTDLAVMYRRNGNPVEAIKRFDQAIALDSKHEQSRFNKGIVLMYDLNDISGAIDTWQELLTVKPDAIAPNGIPLPKIIADAKAQLASGEAVQPQ